MGTRHLIAVQADGRYPIAQYGQWDGYPEGNGLAVLHFVRDDMNEALFKAKCLSVREVDDEWKLAQFPGAQSLDEVRGQQQIKRYFATHPQLSRDASATVLGMVQSSPDGLPIETEISFAGESLMCEWAYVIDLDKRTFEVFKGFNKEPLDENERFHGVPGGDFVPSDGVPYQPVKHRKTWSLDELPSDDDFLAEFVRDDETEDA